jgi:hypothetical protein
MNNTVKSVRATTKSTDETINYIRDLYIAKTTFQGVSVRPFDTPRIRRQMLVAKPEQSRRRQP